MATFSENQVRQLYVAKDTKAISTAKPEEVGVLNVKSDTSHETMWIAYKGVGGITASDKIKVANIVSMKAMKSTAMETPLNRVKVALRDDKVVAGQDYLLRVVFSHFVGMSDEDLYFKYGMVHGTANMTTDIFYKTLAVSLAKNIAREDNKLMNIYVHSESITSGSGSNSKFDASGFAPVTALSKVDDKEEGESNSWYNGTSGAATDIDYIVLEEVEQPWILGKMAVGKIPFEVQPDTIVEQGDEFIWGVVTKEASKAKISNGKMIADLEYFCMGERGDLYRGIGWPNNIETKYLVDPKHNYDVLDITYFYAGDNEDIQKSLKTITIVADNASANKLIKAVIAAVNTATNNKPALPEEPQEH